MGRRTITDEERLERFEPHLRADLTLAHAMHQSAIEAQANAAINFKRTLQRAVVESDVTYRDLEALLGIPRATINALVLS